MNAVICPYCREPLEIPLELRGSEVRCAGCEKVFVVPTGPTSPPLVPVRMPRAERSFAPQMQRPKSNRKVWILLVVTFVIVGGITATCAGLMAWSTNPRMYPATEADGRFKLEMPGEPRAISLPGEGGVPVKGFECSRAMSEDRYSIKYYDLPADADIKDPQAILTAAIQREVVGTAPGPETSRIQTTHDGYPALDAWYESGPVLMGKTTILRAILIGRRVYLMGAKGSSLQPQMWWVMRFFKSFEVAEGPAKDVKKAEK